MVEPFLTVVEKIIQFAQVRRTNRREAFERIVEPLFIEIRPLVDDYFTLFRDTERALKRSRRKDIFPLLEKVRMRRERLLHERRMVTTMAEAVRETVKDSGIKSFAETIQGFFFSSYVEANMDRPMIFSESALMVDLLDCVNSGILGKTELLSYLALTLRQLEASWIHIAREYAKLKLRTL